jgi:hypothetical protein
MINQRANDTKHTRQPNDQENTMSKAIARSGEATDTAPGAKPYQTRGEIENLVSAFEACSLPKPLWTHRAHLLVALWYNLRYDADEALRLVRERIRRYNEAVGTANTETSGYHETITVFYMWAVRRFLADTPADASLVEVANALARSRCAEKDFPFTYYSRECLLSAEARRQFIEPDIRGLEEVRSHSEVWSLESGV